VNQVKTLRVFCHAPGLWGGRIQRLQEFLGLPMDPWGELERLALEELEIRHGNLHREYEVRFKR
jgi:hypothetical protein